METLFTKIIRGEIPCYKIFEDEKTFAFLDLFPIAEGHTLVVPKTPANSFLDLDEATYLEVMKNARTIALAIQKATDCQRVCTMVQGYEVPHFHYHLIPTNTASDFYPKEKSKASDESLKIMQGKILSFL